MTANLSPDLLTTLIALLTPHIQTPHERLSLFTRAFTSVDEALLRRIDFTGSIDDFAPPMLRTLATAPRQEEVSALWRLLLIVHADTGEDQRKQIDALKERIHAITPLDTPEALPTIPEEALPRRRGGTPRLFISYSQADRTLVLEIARRLSRDFSYDVWIDVNNLPGGKDWMEELARGVQSADVILFMATPTACASRYCHMEIDHARTHHKRIIPIRLADGIDLDAAGLPPRAHYVDGMSGIDALLNKLTQPDNLPPVLARDRRLLDPHFRELHRRYLRMLFRRYGTVRLKQQLGVELGREVSLFDVYVPLKLGVSFNIEVHDGEMSDGGCAIKRKNGKKQKTCRKVQHSPSR